MRRSFFFTFSLLMTFVLAACTQDRYPDPEEPSMPLTEEETILPDAEEGQEAVEVPVMEAPTIENPTVTETEVEETLPAVEEPTAEPAAEEPAFTEPTPEVTPQEETQETQEAPSEPAETPAAY